MRKIKKNLLLIITSLMCLVVMFGYSSIESIAESNEAATEVRFEGDHIHFKAILEGYYACLIANSSNGSKEKIFYLGCVSGSHVERLPSGRVMNRKIMANESIDAKYNWEYNQPGKMTLYILYSPEPITISYYKTTIDDYKSDTKLKISSYSKVVSKKMPIPKDFTIGKEPNGKYVNIKSGSSSLLVNYASNTPRRIEVGDSSGYNVKDSENFVIRTMSDNLNEYVNSDPVTISMKDIPVAYHVTLTSSGPGRASVSPKRSQNSGWGIEGSKINLYTTASYGYRFKEWQVVSGNVTIENNSFIFGKSDVEIKAIFEEDPDAKVPVPCVIVFDENGGSGYMDIDEAMSWSEYVLPPCTFTPPAGKVFDRWDKGEVGSKILITECVLIKALWKDIDEGGDEYKAEDKAETKTSPSKSAGVTQKENNAPSVNGAEQVATKNNDPNLKTTKFAKLTAKKNSATLTWKKQNKGGIKGYEIQYSTDKRFKKDVKSVTVSKAKTTSKTIKKLKTGKKYYFRIRTYKKSGSEKIYSNWSKSKNVNIK